MKQLLIIALVVLGTMSVQSQELNTTAKALKTSESEVLNKTYKEIKADAVAKWGDDHEMVVYRINNQAKAFYRLVGLEVKQGTAKYDIMVKAMSKWTTDNGYDYEMVMYTYDNQIKALSAY